MGAWYTIGLYAGLGTAIAIAFSAALRSFVPALVAAVVVAAVLGLVLSGWPQAIGGAAGAACGTIGAAPLVAGALRRGGTRGGTATLLVGVAIVAAALAFVPVVGYLEAVAVAVLGLRLRGRAPDRHAGLRTLAK